MKIIRSIDIQKKCENKKVKEWYVETDMFISEDAKQYIEKNNVILRYKKHKSVAKKAEHITNLNAKQLVVKTDPRIILRGKLDSFQAKLLEVQITAEEMGKFDMLEMLQDVMEYSHKILLAEVLDKEMEADIKLIGYDQEELRYVSQHPKEYYGVGHIAPDYKIGKLSVLLNRLRTESREVELAAVNAFCKNNKPSRVDILRALNRLSSGLYIIYLQCLVERGGYGDKQ